MSHVQRRVIVSYEMRLEFTGSGAMRKADSRITELQRSGLSPKKQVQEFRRGQWRDVEERPHGAETGGAGSYAGDW